MARVDTLGMLSSNAHQAFDALTWDVGVAVDTDAGCKTSGALPSPGASSYPQSWLDLAFALSTDFRSEDSSSALKHALVGGEGDVYSTTLQKLPFPTKKEVREEKGRRKGQGGHEADSGSMLMKAVVASYVIIIVFCFQGLFLWLLL